MIKKFKAENEDDRRYYWWRMLTKQRLYKKHKELLNELELLDRVEKLDATVQNVEEGYEITLDALEGRLPEDESEEEAEANDQASKAPTGSRDRRVKRKLTVMEDDDDEEEDGTELAKRPRV